MSQPADSPLTSRQAADLAARHGLRRLGARPRLVAYVKALIRRRHFIRLLATSDAMGRNQGSYLGQVWAVLNPLLQFAIYFLVFGVVLSPAKAGTGDFVSYLAVGTFLFGFMSSGLTTGSKAISSRLGLVRALEFPRAVLPISVTLTEVIMMWPALVVMVLVMLLRKQFPDWSWLMLLPDMILMYAFTLGCGLILARICSNTPDFANLVPIATNLLRFMSGVFYNVAAFTSAGSFIGTVLHYQPFSLYLKLARGAMMTGRQQPGWVDFSGTPLEWGFAVFWAVAFLSLGFIFFWRAEARYGRS